VAPGRPLGAEAGNDAETPREGAKWMTLLLSLSLVLAILWIVESPVPASAQTTPGPASSQPATVRAVLASARLPSVVDTPLHYKLFRVSLPAGRSASYTGPQGILYQISGSLTVSIAGQSEVLHGGAATFIGTGQTATLRTADPKAAAVFLHFILAPAGELDGANEVGQATLTELYRTTALPGLNVGPYEFTLTRVTFPPRLPLNPPHHRSGAALYYVLSGSGTNVLNGQTVVRPAGSTLLEPYGLVHQWANPGQVPLVLLQANISPEGAPAVIIDAPK
jgi:quercetin dioxygenase-like cupin family protein